MTVSCIVYVAIAAVIILLLITYCITKRNRMEKKPVDPIETKILVCGSRYSHSLAELYATGRCFPEIISGIGMDFWHKTVDVEGQKVKFLLWCLLSSQCQ